MRSRIGVVPTQFACDGVIRLFGEPAHRTYGRFRRPSCAPLTATAGAVRSRYLLPPMSGGQPSDRRKVVNAARVCSIELAA